jgi:hypothetical protein
MESAGADEMVGKRSLSSYPIHRFYAYHLRDIASNSLLNTCAQGHSRHIAGFAHAQPFNFYVHVIGKFYQFHITAIYQQMWPDTAECILDAIEQNLSVPHGALR